MDNRLSSQIPTRTDVIWVAVGAALILLFIGPALLPGQALLPADLLFTDPVWQASTPDGFQKASNDLLVDQVYQFYPWRQFAQTELQQGRWPLWNPLNYAGTPLIANDQSAVFYPIHLLLAWLPPFAVPGWSALLRLWVAFGGMFVLLRRWKRSPGAGFVGGISFALGCFMMPLLGHPHTNVGVSLPLMLLTADGTVTSKRPWPWVIGGSAVIGIQFLGGHAETSFFALMLWSIYGLVALFMQRGAWRERGVRIGLLALSFIIGCGVAAVQLLPFLELLPQSNYFLFRAEEAQRQPWLYTGFWRNAAMATTLFFPDFFGNPTRSGWWIGTGFGNYTNVLYMGIVPLFLAASALLSARKPGAGWRVRFFAIFGLTWLGIILRLPVLDLVRRLPLFDISAISLVVFSGALAILAGFGFDALFAPDAGNHGAARRMQRNLVVFGILGGGGMMAGYTVLRLFKGFFMDLGQVYVEKRIFGNPPHPFPLSYYLDQLDARYQQVVATFDPVRFFTYAPVLVALSAAFVLWLWNRARLSRTVAQVLIGLLIFVDLWIFGAGFNPVIPAHQLFPATPALTFLSQNPGPNRIVAVGAMLPANTGMPYGLSDARGYDVTIGRYSRLLDDLDRTPTGLLPSARNARFFDLTGVRFLLSEKLLSEDELSESGDLQLVFDGEIKVYERAVPVPRANLVTDFQLLKPAVDPLAQILDPAVAGGHSVLLEKMPPILVQATGGTDGWANILTYQPDSVTLTVETDQPALLVLSDAYYPGWRAFVDGVETEILRANYAFRAVVVPAGNTLIRFIYRPASFQIGGVITLISLGLLAVTGGWLWRTDSRRRQHLSDRI